MDTTREMLKAMTFTVADVLPQQLPWSTDGAVGATMPPGSFVVLEPKLAPLNSDHCAVGLKAMLVRPDQSYLLVEYRAGRRQEDGLLCLFLGEGESSGIVIGDELRFVEP